MGALIEATGVTVRTRDRDLLADVDVTVRGGEIVCVVGPNGAGKTTLLRALSGEAQLTAGTVCFDGLPLPAWSARELARRRSVMAQSTDMGFSFTAEEVVAMGRYPHGGGRGNADRQVIQHAMHVTEVRRLAPRCVSTLSGGERQRVHLARALAQLWNQPGDAAGKALLLDEPTSSLDPEHQHRVLQIARDTARAGGAVIAVLHDLNLAVQYADTVLLLEHGRTAAWGPVHDVLTESRIEQVFRVGARVLRDSDDTPPLVALRPRKVSLHHADDNRAEDARR